MFYLLLLIFELLLLYLLSRKFTKLLTTFFYRITKSKRSAYVLYAIFFLPGTFIHEMAHFLTALVLLVPVGNINLMPKINDDGVRLGSVPIGKTDPLRRLIVGFAPIVFGVGIILITIYLLIDRSLYANWLYLFLTIFIIFQVANNMFLSKSDLKGALALILVTLLVVVILYLLGFKLSWSQANSIFSGRLLNILKTSILLLAVPVIIDIVGIKLLNLFFERG